MLVASISPVKFSNFFFFFFFFFCGGMLVKRGKRNDEWEIHYFKYKMISVQFSSLIMLYFREFLWSTLNEFPRYKVLNLLWNLSDFKWFATTDRKANLPQEELEMLRVGPYNEKLWPLAWKCRLRPPNSTKIDLNFTATDTQDYAPLQRQATNSSHSFKTKLNLLRVTFPVILKWTEINLRWLIVDGLCKKGKGLTITGNIQEPWRYHSFLTTFFFCPFITLKFVDVWAKHLACVASVPVRSERNSGRAY